VHRTRDGRWHRHRPSRRTHTVGRRQDLRRPELRPTQQHRSTDQSCVCERRRRHPVTGLRRTTAYRQSSISARGIRRGSRLAGYSFRRPPRCVGPPTRHQNSCDVRKPVRIGGNYSPRTEDAESTSEHRCSAT
jgi:hypothetical protein